MENRRKFIFVKSHIHATCHASVNLVGMATLSGRTDVFFICIPLKRTASKAIQVVPPN